MEPEENKGGWVAYRPELKVLDCTVRDGGLVNDHQFDDEVICSVYDACVAAGIDYMEIGYKGDKSIYSPTKYGPWKHCDEDHVRRILGDRDGDIKLSVMADAERTNYKEDILQRDDSVFDCIRVACYIHQIPTAIDMVKDAHDKGYEAFIQLMAISIVSEHDMRDALDIVAKSEAESVYIVDSFGALYGEQVRDLTKIYMEAVEGTGMEIGFHGHNNQQLAFANTVEAIVAGANRVDGTISGIGRGAGNCPMELLLGFLHNPKFKLRPILECNEKIFAPLAKELDWGYSVPYAITGQLNRHPKPAIELRASDEPDKYVDFYDQVIEED